MRIKNWKNLKQKLILFVIVINVKFAFKILHEINHPIFLSNFTPYFQFYQSTKFPLYISSSMVQFIAQSTALITDFQTNATTLTHGCLPLLPMAHQLKSIISAFPSFFTPTDFLLPLSSASVGRKNTVSSFGHIKQ